jgi:uncharacterized membrane protein
VRPGYWIIAVWAAIFCVRTTFTHNALGTNAYDLSVFDYSLWSTLHGAIGQVPFMGQSIASQHFMPILLALVPVYAVWPSPVLLIAVQASAFVGAALCFFRFSVKVIGLAPVRATALLVVFLLARRSHGAVTSFFYPECFQAVLVFGLAYAWHRERWRAYWIQAALFLATKEDAAIYLVAFGAVQFVRHARTRRQSSWTMAVGAAWVVVALLVAIPASRIGDGLNAANPLIADRYGDAGGEVRVATLAMRIISADVLRSTAALLIGLGLLPLGGPEDLIVAAPGLLVNAAARRGTMQAALTGHYVWAVLPWLFAAAAWGLRRVELRSGRAAAIWTAGLLVVTCADSPLLRRIAIVPDVRPGRHVQSQIRGLPPANTVLAQPNLVPHLPHSHGMFTLGVGPQPTAPELVLLTEYGDLWPLNRARVKELVAQYRSDPHYRVVSEGPLFAFARRTD